jgi:excisionase family DNA binding protein
MGIRDEIKRMVEHTPAGSLVPIDHFKRLLDAEEGDAAAPSGSPPQRDYTVKEVAKMEGRKPPTVRAWIRRGELEAYLYRGKEQRITPAALEAFRERQRSGKGRPQLGTGSIPKDDLGSWRTVRRPHAA